MKSIAEIASLVHAAPSEILRHAQRCGFSVQDPGDVLQDDQIAVLAAWLQQQMAAPTAPSDPAKEARAQRFLQNLVRNSDLIFLDTSSLLYPTLNSFLERLTPLLTSSVRVIVPLRVIEEVTKHRKNLSEPERAAHAINGYQKLVELQNAGLLKIYGNPDDNFADSTFQSVFIKKRTAYRMTLLTQDVQLAKTIDGFNEDVSVRAKHIQVAKLNRFGYASSYIWKDAKDAAGASPAAPKHEPAFRLKTQMTNVPDTILRVREIPGPGSRVLSPDGPIQLLEKISDGAEGIIYKTSSGMAAKIYRPDHLTARQEAKLRRMLSHPLQCEGICYPTAPVLNLSGEFVGFLMPLASGHELQRSLFIKPLFLQTFPGWKKRDCVELCLTLLKKIRFLHQNGILVGDLNPRNILVKSPREVWLVDVDSFQIEEFPCPVGTTTFTAPEIQGKNFGTFLRTTGNEDFAVATLLFMLMLPGKPPYAQQGGESLADNILAGDFSYPLGTSSNKKTPQGPWRYVWSHLTYEVKEMFYNTFRIDGTHHSENERYSVHEWIGAFQKYLRLLDDGTLAARDPMSAELFPTRFKHSTGWNGTSSRNTAPSQPRPTPIPQEPPVPNGGFSVASWLNGGQ